MFNMSPLSVEYSLLQNALYEFCCQNFPHKLETAHEAVFTMIAVITGSIAVGKKSAFIQRSHFHTKATFV